MDEQATTLNVVEESQPSWDVCWSPEGIAKLVEALAKAQLKYKPVLKRNENEAFKRGNRVSKYADLAEYLDATQAALAAEGLVVMQWPDISPVSREMRLVTILAHSSGEWMKGKLTLPAIGRGDFSAQTCGSAITYGRRFAYGAITGCASEDDDGNSTSQQGTKAAQDEVVKDRLAGKPVPALFYSWNDASQSALITGDKELMSANKDVLLPLKVGKELVASADQLETLKFQLEERAVTFKRLQS